MSATIDQTIEYNKLNAKSINDKEFNIVKSKNTSSNLFDFYIRPSELQTDFYYSDQYGLQYNLKYLTDKEIIALQNFSYEESLEFYYERFELLEKLGISFKGMKREVERLEIIQRESQELSNLKTILVVA